MSKKNPHKFCADEVTPACVPTPEGKKGEQVCVEGADCCPTPAFKKVRCLVDPEDDCKKISEVYFVDCDGVEIPDACEVPCPPMTLTKIVGGAISLTADTLNVNLAPVIAAITASCDKIVAALQNLTVSVDFGDLLAALTAACNKIVAAIAASQTAVVAAINALLAALTDLKNSLIAALDANCAKLAGLITALQAALIAALTANCNKIVAAIVEACEKKIAAIKEQTEILCKKLEDISFENGDIEECCTGGATPATAVCYNVPKSIMSSTAENCSYSIAGVDLPQPYTEAQFAAALQTAMPGATIGTDEDSEGRVKVCTSGALPFCYNGRCLSTGEGPVVGSLTRVCIVGVPNTVEEECTNFLRTWGKYEEPIANTLQTQLQVQEELLAKACEQLEQAEVQTAKLCLIEAHSNPAGPCPAEVPEEGLDKEARTLTLKGNVTASYPAGQSINLQDANGAPCGSATAAAEPAPVYDSVTGLTTIAIEECELDEGKVPAAIKQATPITKTVKTAIKTVKAFAVKQVVATPIKVLTFDAIANTMVLDGDATKSVNAESQLKLLDAEAKEIGTAVVAAAKYDEAAKQTRVSLSKNQLAEGADAKAVKAVRVA